MGNRSTFNADFKKERRDQHKETGWEKGNKGANKYDIFFVFLHNGVSRLHGSLKSAEAAFNGSTYFQC